MILKLWRRISKLLSFNENIQTYSYPILKMLVCGLLIATLICRKNFLPDLPRVWNIITTIISFVIGILSMLCFEIAVAEIISLSERREKIKKNAGAPACALQVTVENIVSLAKKNDIIEFCILVNNRHILLGTSANSKQGSSHFFDKHYYVDDKEFLTLEEFTQLLIEFSTDGTLCVIEIDGTKPQHYRQLQQR